MEFALSFNPGAELLGSSLRTIFLAALLLTTVGVGTDFLHRSGKPYSGAWRPVARIALSILWFCLISSGIALVTYVVLALRSLAPLAAVDTAMLAFLLVAFGMGCLAWHAILGESSSDRPISLVPGDDRDGT